MNEIVLTEKEQAEALHKQITSYGEVIYQSLYGMCTAIKQMRDGKLYRAFGHSTFESYAQKMLGMTARQAYSYISIADKLSEDFVKSNSQIGVQKLYLLAMAPEETRNEIVQTTDLTDTTVKELREQLAALAQERETEKQKRLAAQETAAHNEALLREKDKALKNANDRIDDQCQKIDSLKAQISEQADQITELESRPIEVVFSEENAKEVERLRKAMNKIDSDWGIRYADLQEEHVTQRREDLQRAQADIVALREEYEKKLSEAQSSEAAGSDTKEVFKAYLANAIDAVKRMTAFLADHPNEACRVQAEKFFTAIMQEVRA